jgi:DNA-binding transcriptional ArsR family regulator
MEQRHIAAGRQPDHESSQPLPEELARSLAPKTRHALNHPMRRSMLRALNRGGATPRTPDELLPLFPGASRATIAYHAAVLRECGGVSMIVASAERGASARSFVSEVVDDLEYHRVLAATEQLDAAA